MAALSVMQKQNSPEEQIAGLAVALRLLMYRHGLSGQQIIEVGDTLLNRAFEQTPNLRAAALYAERELTL